MNSAQRIILKTVSYCGLALSIIPALLIFGGTIEKATYNNLLVVGMFLWFGTAVWWIKADHLGE